MRGAIANGPKILESRIKQGWTQEQLASLAEVDVKTLRKAERGKRLDLGTLTRLAYALQCELASLVVLAPSERALQVLRRDTVMRWQRAWDQQDLESLLSVYHDDAVLRLPGGSYFPFSGDYRGRTEIRQAHEIAWSTCRTEPARLEDFSLVVSDESVVLQGVKGVLLPGGGSLRLSAVHLFTFRGELILEHQVEYDTLTFAGSLGLLPTNNSPENS